MNFHSEIGKYIKDQDLDGLIAKLHKGVYISKERFTTQLRGKVVDFEWNHLDQGHRIYVHNAYHDALRIATSKDVAISLTAWKNLPIYIQVADMRIDRGLFYQSYTIFGLLFCHQTCRMIQQGDNVVLDIEWRTVSHKWLRFLHGPFNRKMLGLQKKQNNEDIPIRLRRAELRDQGCKFKTDEPDYFNSNTLTDKMIFPETGLPERLDVKTLPLGTRHKFKMGIMEFYALRSNQDVQVWPAVCPHEGAEMPEAKFCEGSIACPWHNRKFKAVKLQNERGQYHFGNLSLSLKDDFLVLNVAQAAPQSLTTSHSSTIDTPLSGVSLN